MSSISILIDCTEPATAKQKILIDNIVSTVNNIDGIAAIVLSDNNHMCTQRARALSGMRFDIKHYLNLSLHQVRLLIEQHNISDIYVFGQHWQECVHDGPLGIDKLLPLARELSVRLLTCAGCVLSEKVQSNKIYRSEYFPALTELQQLTDTTFEIT